MLTHVAVETETLFGGGWPRPSADLENLVASCQASGIPLLVSSVTLTEVETIWLERTGDRLAKAKSTLGALRGDFEGLVPEVALPNSNALRAAYQAAVAEVSERWQWQVVAPPPMTAQEIVELSARHQPPFRGKDTGFRDSYILMSVAMAVAPGSEIGLVTADNGLGDSGALNSYAASRGVTIRRFRTAREALEAIDREVESAELEAIKTEINQRSVRLAEAVRADVDRLTAFVRLNLEVPPDAWKSEGTVQAVRSIQVVDVTEAHAGLPGDARMTASVTVSLSLELEFKTYSFRGPMGMKEGQRDEDRMPALSMAPVVRVTTVPGEATIELRAVWPEEDDGLPHVEYVGIEYGNASDALTRRFTRLLLERG